MLPSDAGAKNIVVANKDNKKFHHYAEYLRITIHKETFGFYVIFCVMACCFGFSFSVFVVVGSFQAGLFLCGMDQEAS